MFDIVGQMPGIITVYMDSELNQSGRFMDDFGNLVAIDWTQLAALVATAIWEQY